MRDKATDDAPRVNPMARGFREVHLTCSKRFSEVDKLPTGKECKVVKELEDFTAGLVNGGDDSPPISCQIQQRGCHKERRGTACVHTF